MVLGKRLRLLRIEKRLTQSQLGQMINLAESTISLYEANKRTPDYHILIRIANFFEVSIDYLIGLTDVRNVIRYQYSDTIPTVNEQFFLNAQKQGSSINEKSELNNNYFWYSIENTSLCPSCFLTGDLLLIEHNPQELIIGDQLLLQLNQEAPGIYKIAQVGDPIILIPCNPTRKPEILTAKSLQQLQLIGRILELRRFYTK